MKTLNNITSSILLLTLLTTGCQNESIPQSCDGDNAQYLETFYSEEFAGIPCELQNIESDKKEVNLVITNQVDLKKYFTCFEQLPEIDFDKYFILAGRYTHNNCAVFDSQQVSICNNKIIFKVKMLEQVCHAVTSVFYATVIEKKYSNLPVDFDVQFKN
jgi:hypothetical protein